MECANLYRSSTKKSTNKLWNIFDPENVGHGHGVISEERPHFVMFNKKAQLSLTNPRDAVEIRVMGHSRASKVTPFDSLNMIFYYRPIVTSCL